MATHDLPDHLPEIAPPVLATERKPDVLAVRDMADSVADAVRLLELPEFRALLDSGEFSFPARTVVSRLMSDYVMLVGWADAVAELLHDARIAARTMEESDYAMNRAKGRRLSASIARVGSAA